LAKDPTLQRLAAALSQPVPRFPAYPSTIFMKPSAQTYFESASPIGLDIGSRGRQPQLDVQ
jgi:hypothetical protein